MNPGIAYKWTDEAIAQFVRILGRYENITDALAEAQRVLGFKISPYSADTALRRVGKGSLSSLLGARQRRRSEWCRLTR